MMRLVALCSLLLRAMPPSRAALDIGDAAPNFTAPAALGGKVYQYTLADALAKGPVVLYFFPAAFSDGCSIEAHEFAEAIPQFEALGATVVGVSGDDIDTLSKFSVQACQGKFPVASDETQSVMKSYDAVMKTRPEYANRVSYVIAPNGKVVYHYMSLNPTKHVEKMPGRAEGIRRPGQGAPMKRPGSASNPDRARDLGRAIGPIAVAAPYPPPPEPAMQQELLDARWPAESSPSASATSPLSGGPVRRHRRAELERARNTRRLLERSDIRLYRGDFVAQGGSPTLYDDVRKAALADKDAQRGSRVSIAMAKAATPPISTATSAGCSTPPPSATRRRATSSPSTTARPRCRRSRRRTRLGRGARLQGAADARQHPQVGGRGRGRCRPGSRCR